MINTPTQLKDYILRRLGAPIINVELTELQIMDCIDRALELYGEYHYDGLHRTYHVFNIQSEDERRNLVFSLKGKGVFAVTQVLRTNVGNITTMDGTATYPWFTDFLLGMAGINSGGGNCAKSFGPNAFGADLSYYSMLMTQRSMLQDMMSPIPNFWYNADTELIKFAGNFNPNDIIVVEAYSKAYISPYETSNMFGVGTFGSNDSELLVSDLYNNSNTTHGPNYIGMGQQVDSGSFNNRWVKDYATSLAKELNGYILAKHQGMALPGGVTINGERMIEEAKLEQEKLREELYLLDTPVGILVG